MRTREDPIYSRNRLFIPDSDELRLRLIQEGHDTFSAGHPWRAKIYEILTRYYYWPGLPADVKRFVRNCRPCSRAKVSRERYHRGDLNKQRQEPFELPEYFCNLCVILGEFRKVGELDQHQASATFV